MRNVAMILVMVGVSFVLVFGGYTHTQAVTPVEKVSQLRAAIEANGAVMQNWTLTAKREDHSVHDIHTFHVLLQTQEHDLGVTDWTFENSAEGYKATAIKNSPQYKERVVVTWVKENTTNTTFIIHEMTGTTWDESLATSITKNFSQNSTIYTCIRAVPSDNMESVLLTRANNILQSLDAKPVEATQERAFVSISAYTGKWNDALAIDKEKINVQVALRNVDNKTTIVIGTPVITSEY
ncbi:YwmB family TATA-box binding protein [Ectobacillus sp. sgz5001026]|uniref:YwmB family TATA-box binding protein n=1 Tax=Ectobacillus sp. sgz5001026 TaxID=3242473 RepID=UPI0036D3E2C2